jgi:hypothetical protein
MALEGFLKLILRVTVQASKVEKRIEPKTGFEPIGIRLVEVYLRGICIKIRDKTKMISMEMSNEKVCFFCIDPKFLQASLHGLNAHFLVPAGINNQISLRILDHVGVDSFQRTPGKRDLDSI